MRRPALDLPPFFSGVNRRVGLSYGRPTGEAAEAMNVETAFGEVQRRRALRSFASAPPLLRPSGATYYATGADVESATAAQGDFIFSDAGNWDYSDEVDVTASSVYASAGTSDDAAPATDKFAYKDTTDELDLTFQLELGTQGQVNGTSFAFGITLGLTATPSASVTTFLYGYVMQYVTSTASVRRCSAGVFATPTAGSTGWTGSEVVRLTLSAAGVMRLYLDGVLIDTHTTTLDVATYGRRLAFGVSKGATTTAERQGIKFLTGVAGLSSGNALPLFVGCNPNYLEQFTGIWVGKLTYSGAPTSHKKLAVDYWSEEGWEEVPWSLDLTKSIQNDYLTPLSIEGAVLWRVADIASDWGTQTIDSITAYWVRLRLEDLVTGLDADPEGERLIFAPGIRLIDLPPVNGLFEGTPGDADALIVGADRAPRGQELGGNLGVASVEGAAKHLRFEIQSHAGWLGTPANPAWSSGGGPAGSFSGTSGSIRKLLEQFWDAVQGAIVNFDWMEGQFQPGLIEYDVTPDASSTAYISLDKSAAPVDQLYEHCRVAVNTDDELGAAEYAEVYASDGDDLYVYPAWSASPNNDTFDVRAPPYKVILWDDSGDELEVLENDADELDLVEDDYTYELPSSFLGHFSIVREMRWEHGRGRRWDFCFNPVTRRVLCANGNEILETDGRVVRRLPADSDSDNADRLVGEMPLQASLLSSEATDASRSQFRSTPPKADYVTVYAGRVFAAKGDLVYWSFPNEGIDIWPWYFSLRVRDPEGGQITGMRTVNNRLVVFTRNQIHEIFEAGDGIFSARPIAQTGFVAQNATCIISYAGATLLAGVTPDGIGVWSGSELIMLLDDWSDVLSSPVNTSRIERSSATYVSSSNQAFFAVPVEDDEYPTRILVREVDTQRWWVWSTSYGVSELAAGRDSTGSTYLLVGYADGFVARLADDRTDDGRSIEGSISTHPAVVPQGGRVALTSALATARILGTQTADLDFYGDSSPVPLKSASGIKFPGGRFVLGSTEIGDPETFDSEPLAGGEFRTQEIRARGTRVAHTISGRFKSTARWALRALQVVLLPKTPRGRR